MLTERKIMEKLIGEVETKMTQQDYDDFNGSEFKKMIDKATTD